MTQPMPEPEPIPEPEPRFEIEISPEIEPGVHADFASIWHTPDTFVLDFASLRRPPFLILQPEIVIFMAGGRLAVGNGRHERGPGSGVATTTSATGAHDDRQAGCGGSTGKTYRPT